MKINWALSLPFFEHRMFSLRNWIPVKNNMHLKDARDCSRLLETASRLVPLFHLFDRTLLSYEFGLRISIFCFLLFSVANTETIKIYGKLKKNWTQWCTTIACEWCSAISILFYGKQFLGLLFFPFQFNIISAHFSVRNFPRASFLSIREINMFLSCTFSLLFCIRLRIIMYRFAIKYIRRSSLLVWQP